MSKEKINKSKWGGARKNAGRPEGATKEKICVSVNKENWQAALRIWNEKQSWLVDALLADFVTKKGNTCVS
jgi:hypothetical protein